MNYELNTDITWKGELTGPVAVLLGGSSAEREVSLETGTAVLEALRAENIEAEPVDTQAENWLKQVSENYQHVFIALHGGDGEGGKVQGALEQIGVSYTGSGVLGSALALDKMRCKHMWQGMGLPTPMFAELKQDSDWQNIIERWNKVIVKPACEGSSIGMTIASSAQELADAYQLARQYGEVMVEQWIQGAEFTVAILGDQSLPVIRMETDHGFYDYEAKYISDDTRYFCPCGLDEKQENTLRELAIKAFNSVSASGWGRVDFMQDELGQFYLLEVNTVPGMTSHSLVPMAAKAAGLSFSQLVAEIFRISLMKS